MNDGPPLLVSARPVLTVDGREDEALGRDLLRLEAREDEHGLATLEAVFLNFGVRTPGDAPGYVHFDRQRLDFGKGVSVAFETGGRRETVFEGKVTALGALYPEQRPPELTLVAEDMLAKLRLARRGRVFENATDQAIVEELLRDTGLRAEVGTPGPRHAQRWQVGLSELALLRERAAALDARISLRDGTLRLATREDGARPIALSTLNELIRFEVRADLAEQRSAVRAHGWDVAGGSAIHEEAGADVAQSIAAAGGRTGPDCVRDAWGEAPEDLHLEMPATADEARQLAEARMKRRARRFVTGRGVTRGTPSIRVGARVELVDLGAWFSGVYEVTAARHRFDQAEGYRTEFEACRPALEPGA
ncbi:MAG: contractile injection system protein, VgrG/Pvc8 family [Rubritepida sp.]|nr:contractile injection system protein, VgrG/Pvc8 family [Rubritepida sp.]